MDEINHKPIVRKRIEDNQGSVVFIGESQNSAASENEFVWKIERRVTQASGNTVSDFVGADEFDAQFSDRENIFPPLPFINISAVQFEAPSSNIRVPDSSLLRFEHDRPFSISFWSLSIYLITLSSFIAYKLSCLGLFFISIC